MIARTRFSINLANGRFSHSGSHMLVWLLLLLIAVLYVYVLNYSSMVYFFLSIIRFAILLVVIPGIAYTTVCFLCFLSLELESYYCK